ncbi:17622_t:CDS:2, partial [Gigaspora margarita]
KKECFTRKPGNSASDDYNVNLSETKFSNMDCKEKEGECSMRRLSNSASNNYDVNLSETKFLTCSDKRKLSKSNCELSSSPISSNLGNNRKKITPQKLMLFKESVAYLQNHTKIDVNGQGMIIKDNYILEGISGIIRNCLIKALTSPKEKFVKAIMTPLDSEASPKDCDSHQICKLILYD